VFSACFAAFREMGAPLSTSWPPITAGTNVAGLYSVVATCEAPWRRPADLPAPLAAACRSPTAARLPARAPNR